jgi:energy-coupling factor transporter ATP-binding protein EcfA2
MENTITGTTPTSALTALFKRGEVYADSWPREVRRQLNVDDPLAGVVAQALDSGQHVVITGNAGDGKSHLLATALDLCKPRREVDAGESPSGALTSGHRVFIRDAATIDDDSISRWTQVATQQGAQLVITLNEGPLTSLAERQDSGFYEAVRKVAHARARGERVSDPEGILLLNLAGRQLVQADFVGQALERLLPAVEPCPTCGDDMACPRTAGRDLLAAAPHAAERITILLRLLGQSGMRLTARELWVFLADLFFGWQCPQRARDTDQLSGWWWSRVFDTRTPVGRAIAREFDPIHSAQAAVDNHLWLGDYQRALVPPGVPSLTPSNIHRRDPSAALRAFESAKRAWFFLAVNLDIQSMIDRQSHIPAYVALIEDAQDEPERVVQRIVTEINRYRLRVSDGKRLHLSRHHRLTAIKRPTLLAASESISAGALDVRLPYLHEDHGVESAGFRPTRLELSWKHGKGAVFRIDYQTWIQLHQPRTVYSDRTQEALDTALDLFLGQAPMMPETDPEIIAVDHSTGATVKIIVRGGRRPMFEVAE